MHLVNTAAAKQVPTTRVLLTSLAPHVFSSPSSSSFALASTARSAFASSGLHRNSRHLAALSIAANASAATPFATALQTLRAHKNRQCQWTAGAKRVEAMRRTCWRLRPRVFLFHQYLIAREVLCEFQPSWRCRRGTRRTGEQGQPGLAPEC